MDCFASLAMTIVATYPPNSFVRDARHNVHSVRNRDVVLWHERIEIST